MVSLSQSHRCQGGHTLAQTLVGMALSMAVVCAAWSAMAWVQSSHLHMQAQADAQGRLRLALQWLRERVQRSGAVELSFDSKGKAAFAPLPEVLQGSDRELMLPHARSLTPADCQGHQASDWTWLMDDFMLNTRQELVCKDSWRDVSSYQALVDGVSGLQFQYAQAFAGNPPSMQWLSADQVSDWRAVRGVAICMQVQVGSALPRSPAVACGTTNQGLSWRGVAAVRHPSP